MWQHYREKYLEGSMYAPILACLMLTFCSLYGEPRIVEMLPNLMAPLAVDPGVPDDFVALSPHGKLNPYDWIYWGPKEVLEAYFKDPSSLSEPVLRVKLSSNVAQTGTDSFTSDKDQSQLPTERLRWGEYPLRASKVTMMGTTAFIAWVGLNDPEAGWTLMFNLVYPDNKGHPDAKDIALWETFLKTTKVLKDADYFIALGQDLQEGYTLVNAAGAKMKVTAERRQSDGMVEVVVTPESPDVSFRYEDMEITRMGAQWKFFQPMVKVYGEITYKEGNIHNIMNYVTSVFFKEVSEFTPKAEGEGSTTFRKRFES